MRIPKSFLPYNIAFILALSAAVFCQDEPKAVLVDEFGAISCGDLLARTDQFIVELQQTPQDSRIRSDLQWRKESRRFHKIYDRRPVYAAIRP